MIKLDDNLLIELGLQALAPDDKKRMLTHIYETLEMRVGMELAKQMSDAQLNEFEQFINRNDEAGALQWLESNFPNYKEVVAAEFEKLKMEIRQVAPQIVADAHAAAQQQQGQPPMPVGPAPGQQMQQGPQPMQQPQQMPPQVPAYDQQPQYQPQPPMPPQYGPQPMPGPAAQPYPSQQQMPGQQPGYSAQPQYGPQPPIPGQYPPTPPQQQQGQGY